MQKWAVIALCGMAGVAEAGNAVRIEGGIDPDEPQSASFQVTQDRGNPVELICDEIEDEENPAAFDAESHVVAGTTALEQSIAVRGLKADTHYHCAAYGDHKSNTVNVWTAPLPNDLAAPEIVVAAADPASTGYTLVNTGDLYFDQDAGDYLNARNYLLILDADGNVRWYYGGPGAGDIDATWLEGEGILFAGQHDRLGKPNAFYPPTIVGLDKQAIFPVDGVTLPATTLAGATEVPGSYNHDVAVSLDGQGIYTLTYSTKTNSAGVAQQGFVLREISRIDGSILWSWDSFAAVANGQLAAINPLAGSVPAFVGDPWHPNTVWETLEGGQHFIYVNLRNLSMVFKIARDNNGLSLPTPFKQSPIVWRMGAFARIPVAGQPASTWPYEFTLRDAAGNPLPADQWFFDQHDIKVEVAPSGEKFMVIYDNGTERRAVNPNAFPYSRLVKIRFTETAPKSAYVVYDYREWNGNPADPSNWSEPFWGGYDELENGNILAAQGHCSFCTLPAGQGGTSSPASHNSTLLELDPSTNTPVWKAVFPDPRTMIYRADRIDGCAIFNNLTYCP